MERFVPMVCCLSVALGCAASDNPRTIQVQREPRKPRAPSHPRAPRVEPLKTALESRPPMPPREEREARVVRVERAATAARRRATPLRTPVGSNAVGATPVARMAACRSPQRQALLANGKVFHRPVGLSTSVPR